MGGLEFFCLCHQDSFCRRNGMTVASMASALQHPSLRDIDSVGDPRLVEDSGNRSQSFRSMARFVEMLSNLGTRSYAKKSKRQLPRRPALFPGVNVDTRAMRARIPARKRAKDQEMCAPMMTLGSSARVSVRVAPRGSRS